MWEEAVIGRMAVHRKGGDVPLAVKNMDPLPGLLIGTYHGFDEGAQTEYEWGGYEYWV